MISTTSFPPRIVVNGSNVSQQFKNWNEAFMAVLKDDPGVFYMIKFPTENDRTRFMDKGECLHYIKEKIQGGGPLVRVA